jgi:hypothetical protein
MSMKFPPNPTRGSLMTYGGKTWRFDGSVWLRIDKNSGGQRGAVGPQGPAGPTGAAGASGIVGSYVSSLNGLTGGINTIGLTFPFAGISTDGITVGVLGMTIGGAISFSEATGEIKNNSSNSAKIDINVGTTDFTIARFDRADVVVTIGDVEGSSRSGGKDTRIVVNDKSETVDVYADQKIHLHDGVLFPESGISLGVGLTFPDGTFQSSAHAPHEFVASFNGATGAIEGVNSFNGVTGAVTTTDLTLEVAGISASGGITTQGGLANISSTNSFRIGVPGTGFGSGPFPPLTYSFPVEIDVVGATDKTNPSILVSHGPIIAGSGNNPLVFDKIGTFTVNSFNGVTGDVEGVNSFNGLTGAVSTTDLTLEVAGISTGGGITIDGGDLRLSGGNLTDAGSISTNTITDRGSGLDISVSGSNDAIAITASSGPVSLKGTQVVLKTGFNSNFVFDSQYVTSNTGNVEFDSERGQFLDLTYNMNTQIGDLDAVVSDTKVNIDPASGGSIEMTTGGTIRETFDSTYRRNTDVATFTINASSSIATGAKTNSLYRIPYDATLTNFDVKASSIGGLTAAIRIAGPDFGDPLTSGITGCSLGVEGLTGSSTVFDQASVTAGNFVLLDIFSNNSGSTGTQAFLTFESR